MAAVTIITDECSHLRALLPLCPEGLNVGPAVRLPSAPQPESGAEVLLGRGQISVSH
jgi:hypothetical protein